MAAAPSAVSSRLGLRLAPVLSALQVPHTQRLGKSSKDDHGAAAGPQVCRAELVQRLLPGNPGPLEAVRLWQAAPRCSADCL